MLVRLVGAAGDLQVTEAKERPTDTKGWLLLFGGDQMISSVVNLAGWSLLLETRWKSRRSPATRNFDAAILGLHSLGGALCPADGPCIHWSLAATSTNFLNSQTPYYTIASYCISICNHSIAAQAWWPRATWDPDSLQHTTHRPPR